MSKKKTNEEFQKEAMLKNTLVTVLSEYVDRQHKILVECNKCHHRFEVLPGSVLRGHGCRKCADQENASNSRLSQLEFIQRITALNENIQVLGTYINRSTPVLVCCSQCKEKFYLTPANAFTRGISCPFCGNRHHADTQEEFEAKVYKVSPNIKILSAYKNGESRIDCECLLCGHTWNAEATGLKQGKGCPHCNISKGENQIEKFLQDQNIAYFSQYKFSDCRDKFSLPFDFFYLIIILV